MTKHKRAKVKEISLGAGHVARIAIPKGHAPVVATDTERGIVEVVPVEKKPEGWWEYLFGAD
jgi:hypothetical protein